jgi:hypothetical protein
MLNEKAVSLYSDYVKAYNIDPDSEKSDYTFSLLADNIFDNYYPEAGDEILNTLCLTENNKINMIENLLILDEELGGK